MAYEFKKLGTVEAVETATDKATVLIEENGVIKRVLKDEVGGVKVSSTASVGQTIVVKSVDEVGKPIEWETVSLDSVVNGIMNKMGIEKKTINQCKIDYSIVAVEDDEDGGYYWRAYTTNNKSNRITIEPGDVLRCIRFTDGEYVEEASFIFPELDEETEFFVGATFLDSYTGMIKYEFNVEFTELVCNDKSFSLTMTIYKDTEMENSPIYFDDLRANYYPDDDLTSMRVISTVEKEFIIINNLAIKDNNNCLYNVSLNGEINYI